MGNSQTSSSKSEQLMTQIYEESVKSEQSIKIKDNPYPVVPDYLNQLESFQSKDQYPKVPNYLNHELITDIQMLKHIIEKGILIQQQNKSENHSQAPPTSRLIDVNEQQSKISGFQTQLKIQIKQGSLSQIDPDLENLILLKDQQLSQSLSLILKYAYFTQGLLKSLSNNSTEFLISLNNLILCVNMNGLFLQFINYYDYKFTKLRTRAQLIWQELIQNGEFDSSLKSQFIIVEKQLSSQNTELQQIFETSMLYEFEDQLEEPIVEQFLKIQQQTNIITLCELSIDHLQKQKSYIIKGEQKGQEILENKDQDKFIKDKLEKNIASSEFIFLLNQFIQILEYKKEYTKELPFILMGIKNKDQILKLLLDFSKLNIQSSLSLVHYCITELQSKLLNDQSVLQLQKFAKKIDSN